MKRAILAVFCGFVFAIGCAAGTDVNGDDVGADPDAGDSHVTIDANNNLPIDARPIDASIPIDASLPIDAAPPGGLDIGETCTASAQCLSACCFGGFGICFEDPGVPGACI